MNNTGITSFSRKRKRLKKLTGLSLVPARAGAHGVAEHGNVPVEEFYEYGKNKAS